LRGLLTDALGSTVALTDAAAAVQTQYTYEPFGAVTPTGPTSGNPFQYTGREHDGTGLYSYRARYYSPRLHRFLGEDPHRFSTGDMNFYSYTANNPVNLVDPLGLWTFGVGVQFSGTAIGFGGSVSLALVIDGLGQVGFTVTGGAVGAGSSGLYGGSVVGQVTGSNAGTIDDLSGPGGTAGTSIQAGNLVGQIEYFTGQNYSGFTGGFGAGVPGGASFTMTGEVTGTKVFCLVFCLPKGPAPPPQPPSPPGPSPQPPPPPGGRKG